MKIFIDLTPADFITLFGLGFLCALFFLITGIMLVVTKNTNLISKKNTFKMEKTFTLIYGLVNIVFSVLMIVILIIAFIKTDLHLTLFILLAITVLTMLIIEYMLQKKFREK